MFKLIVVCMMTCCLLLAGCKSKSSQKNSKIPQTVKIYTVGEENSSTQRKYPGRVIPSQEVDLSFLVSGQIIEFPVLKGQIVEANTLLASLDPKDYKIALNEAKAIFEKARGDFERAKILITKNTISQSQYDETKSKYDVAQSKYEASNKALQDSKLIAPFKGVIARTYVNNFQLVQAKQKILSLQAISQIDISINLPEQDLVNIGTKSKDGKLKLVVDAIPNRLFDVSVKEFNTESDPITNTYKIILTMPSPKEVTILPGMSVTVFPSAQNQTNEPKIEVPLDAVAVSAAGDRFVWIIDENMKVHKKTVKIGDIVDNKIAILEGLKANDRIVSAGIANLSEGMPVKLWSNQMD
ncbi:MAG: efflux RND transporter periplasmic adaptor subunit [Candidatus Berkiella sp.]